MNKLKTLFLFILLIIGVNQIAHSQKKVWVKFGDQSMLVHDGYSASKFYEKALVLDSTDLSVKYKLAKALMAYQNFQKALPICLNILSKKAKDDFQFLQYDLGKIYKHLGDFSNSKKHFELYVKHGDKSSFEHMSAKNELANFYKVQLLVKDTFAVKVNNLRGNVNTGASEFSPILLNDSVLLFSTLRAMTVLGDGTIKDLDYSAGIFSALKSDSGWTTSFEYGINEGDEKSIANGSFNADNSEFYFSICDNFSSCNIYQGKLINDSIASYLKLPAPINLPDGSSTHPHLVEIKGKKLLVFSSDRVGGKGGMDLWCANFGGKWGAVKNLGKSVNTPGDELTPFYDVDSSKLYFSSDWHYNIGGLDIFSVQGTFPSKWDTAANMGIPYNSPLNDLYFIRADNSEGFLTSSRVGSKTEKDAPCCNDIYDFKVEQVIVRKIAPAEKVSVVSTLYQLPVKVYFHNDRPNVDSWDTLTSLNYDTTYFRYTPRYEEYKKEFSAQFKAAEVDVAKLAVDTFFNDFLYKGHDDLVLFANKLIHELGRGGAVEVLMQGFASPLTTSRYNVNLSKRRISSVMNFLEGYKGGVLKQYMNSIDSTASKLTFVKNYNGEYKSQKGVSDDYYDVRNSIFNPNAALERKVELYAILTYYNEAPVVNLFDTADTVYVNVGSKGVELLNNSSNTITEIQIAASTGAFGSVYTTINVAPGELRSAIAFGRVQIGANIEIKFEVEGKSKELVIICR